MHCRWKISAAINSEPPGDFLMNVEKIEGPRVVVPDLERPQVLFLLEGPGAPLAMPLVEPLELPDVRAVLLEGSLPEAVVPDALSVQIVRETFFEFEVSSAYRRAAVNYLFQRLETCEPPVAGPLFERALVWMEQHLDEPLTLELLSEQFDCSKSGLLAAFKRAGLRPPMKELARLRIEKACELLGENELNISQVARAVGYDDLAAFNHFFRRHTGRSPGDWRENCLWLM